MQRKRTKTPKSYRTFILTATLFASLSASTAYAISINQHFYYGAVNVGIFQGSFNQNYLDQTDAIKQNISETVLQNGYTGGLAVGYSYLYKQKYFLGAELSANMDTYYSKFQSGAATSAFSDTTKIPAHFDLVFVPGLLLSETIEGYVKVGISYALTHDYLSSPVGYTPTITNYNSSKNILGFAAGLGVKKFLTDHIFIFTEGNYHDYSTNSYKNLENFTAQYKHTAHINSYDAVLGIAHEI